MSSPLVLSPGPGYITRFPADPPLNTLIGYDDHLSVGLQHDQVDVMVQIAARRSLAQSEFRRQDRQEMELAASDAQNSSDPESSSVAQNCPVYCYTPDAASEVENPGARPPALPPSPRKVSDVLGGVLGNTPPPTRGRSPSVGGRNERPALLCPPRIRGPRSAPTTPQKGSSDLLEKAVRGEEVPLFKFLELLQTVQGPETNAVAIALHVVREVLARPDIQTAEGKREDTAYSLSYRDGHAFLVLRLEEGFPILGKGADNVVRLGVWINLETLRARLTAARSQNILHEGARLRVENEMAFLAAIRSRFVIPPPMHTCVGETREEFSELFAGGTLREAWKRAADGERLGYCADVAEGLSDVHAAGVVHQDFHPDNALVSLDGPRAVVADLGRSRWVKEMTPPEKFRGCIFYAPPENGVETLQTEFGDVYGFGISIYELFTGNRPPFSVKIYAEASRLCSIFTQKSFSTHYRDLLAKMTYVEMQEGLFLESVWENGIGAQMKPILEACLKFNAQDRPEMAWIAREIRRLSNDSEASVDVTVIRN